MFYWAYIYVRKINSPSKVITKESFAFTKHLQWRYSVSKGYLFPLHDLTSISSFALFQFLFFFCRNIKCLVFLLITLNLAKSFVPRFHNTARDPQKRDPVKGPRFRDPVRDPQERDPVLPFVVGDPQVPHSDLHPIVSDPEERDPVKVQNQMTNGNYISLLFSSYFHFTLKNLPQCFLFVRFFSCLIATCKC